MKRSVFVTGATGFIGQHLVRRLRQLDYSVDVSVGDIRHLKSTQQSYHTVVHLAALNRFDISTNGRELYDVNVMGTMAVLDLCRRTGARCILMSSSAVYGQSNGRKRPCCESDPLVPTTTYGLSKFLAEQVGHFYASTYDVSVAMLRLFNVYGPGQPESFVLPYIIDCLARGVAVELNTPEAIRDFVYVDDVVNAVIAACHMKSIHSSALNIGTGRGVSVREAAQVAAGRLGTSAEIRAPETSNDDTIVADLTMTRQLLDWKPQVALSEGIDKIIQSQYDHSVTATAF